MSMAMVVRQSSIPTHQQDIFDTFLEKARIPQIQVEMIKEIFSATKMKNSKNWRIGRTTYFICVSNK